MPVRLLLNSVAQAHGLPDVVVTQGALTAFRLRARVAIRGRQNSPKIGLFQSDSHRVVHIPNCLVHHPLINQAAGVVRRALLDARVPSYSDGAHLGIARYLQLVVERRSQTVQVVLVGNCASAEPLQGCFTLIRERLGEKLHSLWFNANTGQGNAILGSDWQLIHGPQAVIETFGGAEVHYPPGAFGQSNLEIAGKIIERIRQHLPHGARVAEFYAGVGAIGLSVIDQLEHLEMNESSPQSLRGMEFGMAALAAHQRGKIAAIAGLADDARMMAQDAQIVILDPPRKGIDAKLRDFLGHSPPEKLIYVSCGLESFMADTAVLTASQRMRLTSLEAFNLMPFTEHVETLAIFERSTLPQ